MRREYRDAARSRSYRPSLRVGVHSCAFVVNPTKKPCAGKTHGQALASFGGITRIRFKGSSTNRDLSAIRLPRTFTRSYGHKNRSQSRERVIGYSLLVICKKIAADQSSPRLRLGKHGRLYT